MTSSPANTPKPIKRLNTTLPDALAEFVGEITGKDGLYETPSEFVRDLIRRYMEHNGHADTQGISRTLRSPLSEKRYNHWKRTDLQNSRNIISP